MALKGEKRGACRLLVGKTKGKRPLGRLRCRWKDTLVIHFKKWDGAWPEFIWLRIETVCGVL